MMSNDAFIDDSYLQAQQEQEAQEYELWLYEQQIEQANKELNIWSKQNEHIRHTT